MLIVFYILRNKESSFSLVYILFAPKRGELARNTLGGSVTLEKTACINMV